MLGKGVAGGNWDKAGECRAAHPAASAAFLKALTKCYAERRESYGDAAPDPGSLVAECRDEVLLTLPASDANSAGLVEVRCARQQRCEKVAPADCKASFAKLDAAQRAMMSTMYDGRALSEIADCLASAPCKDDGDEDRCYASVADELVYYPR
jgi:hypothetical protein